MKIAIMQPYFFPYIGYLDLINNVDLFIVYDTVQYIRRGWIHRNRILHPSGTGWQYVVVPTIKASQKTPIYDICIIQDEMWQENILGKLMHYKNSAPYAEQTISLIGECLATTDKFLSHLNVNILTRLANFLDLKFQFQFSSDLGFHLDMERSAEERILDLCEFLNVKEYVNLPGGVGLYHPEAFAARNIKLTFRHLPTFNYSTGPYVFEPNLSIIDVLMWNSPEDVKSYLDANNEVTK